MLSTRRPPIAPPSTELRRTVEGSRARAEPSGTRLVLCAGHEEACLGSRAESFEVVVSADPVQDLDYKHYISCTRGSETVASETSTQLAISPYTALIQPTLPEPDSCSISVSAETPFDTAQDGTVRIEATGIRRPALPMPAEPPPYRYWTRCSLPGWLKSGEAKVHGTIPCARAKAIATAARNKPARAGAFLKVHGYWCRRHELSKTAAVRCTRGPNIIRITGKLRR